MKGLENQRGDVRIFLRDTNQRGIWKVKRHLVPGGKPLAAWQSLMLREVTEVRSEEGEGIRKSL
jgi:hypothetical protein